MKFKVNKNELQKALGTAESILISREIHSVVSTVFLSAQENTLRISSTDLEININEVIEIELIESGEVNIPANKFSQAIRELRTTNIMFECDEQLNVTITDAAKETEIEFQIKGIASDQFPKIMTLSADQYHEMPKDTLLHILNVTSYAMAEEDARYVFNGLYIEADDKQITFVATDGRRLTAYKQNLEKPLPFNKIIIPNKAIREIKKYLPVAKTCLIGYDEDAKRIYFKFDQTDIISKLIDGQYPDYTQVIPSSFKYAVRLHKEGFQNSLKQVAVMAEKPSMQVKFDFFTNRVKLLAQTRDLGESKDLLKIDYDGEDAVLALNSTFVLEALKTMECEYIEFKFSAPMMPVSIFNPDEENLVVVVMPMRIQENG